MFWQQGSLKWIPKILQSWDTTSKHLKPPSAFTQPHKWFQSRTARSCIATLWNDFGLRRRKLLTNAAHCFCHICFDGMAFWCHILSNASSETYMRYFAWKACAAHVANAKWLQIANEPWFNMHKGATALGSFLGGVEVVLCCCASISLCLVDCLFSIASRASFRRSGTPFNRLNASTCCWVVSFTTMRTIAPLAEADASFNSFVDLQRLHRVPVEGFAAFSSLPNIHLLPSIPTHFRGIERQSHYALYTLTRKLNSRKRAYVNNYCRKFSQYSRRRIQQTMPVLLKHLEIM